MRKLFERIVLFFSGAVVLYAVNFLFDYALYPFVILKAGLWKGFVIMTILSFVSSLLSLVLYIYLKRDLFALEYAKNRISEFINNERGNILTRTFRNAVKQSRFLMYAIFSFYDPFIGTVFMRQNYQFTSMAARDWKILIMSVIIANVVWVPAIFAGVSLIEYFYQLFS